MPLVETRRLDRSFLPTLTRLVGEWLADLDDGGALRTPATEAPKIAKMMLRWEDEKKGVTMLSIYDDEAVAFASVAERPDFPPVRCGRVARVLGFYMSPGFANSWHSLWVGMEWEAKKMGFAALLWDDDVEMGPEIRKRRFNQDRAAGYKIL